MRISRCLTLLSFVFLLSCNSHQQDEKLKEELRMAREQMSHSAKGTLQRVYKQFEMAPDKVKPYYEKALYSNDHATRLLTLLDSLDKKQDYKTATDSFKTYLNKMRRLMENSIKAQDKSNFESIYANILNPEHSIRNTKELAFAENEICILNLQIMVYTNAIIGASECGGAGYDVLDNSAFIHPGDVYYGNILRPHNYHSLVIKCRVNKIFLNDKEIHPKIEISSSMGMPCIKIYPIEKGYYTYGGELELSSTGGIIIEKFRHGFEVKK